MNILILGVGVIGTVYAAKLKLSGHQVTVLARGGRLTDIRRCGLEIENVVTGIRSTTQVDTTERLLPGDQYDVAIITVRRDQLASLVPDLAANRAVSKMLFLLNNPIGSAKLVQTLGQDRVWFGFPGLGGTKAGSVIRYAMIAQQPTTLGQWGGGASEELRKMAGIFRRSGFPTRISNKIDDWLKTHAFFVTAVCGAIYLAGGDCDRLSKDDPILKLMVGGIREGFTAVRSLGLTVTPFPLKVLFSWLPRPFAVRYWRRFFAMPMAEYVFGRHARVAAQEMGEIAVDCMVLLEKAGRGSSALTRLYGAIDDYAKRGGS